MSTLFGGGASTVKETAASSLPKLSREDLAEQLKGIAVSTGLDGDNGKGAAGGDFLLCAGEQTKTDKAETVDGQLQITYEANADSCPAGFTANTEVPLTGGTGFATFTYTLGCQGVTIDAKSLRAAAFFRHQSFNFSGTLEKGCLAASQGEGSYRLETKTSYGYDVKLEGKPKTRVEVKTGLAVAAADGTLCRVAVEAGGGILVRNCVYRASTRIDNRPEGSAATSLESLTVATAYDLRAKAGERFYSSGSMDLAVNNWQGKVEFRSGKEPPIAELSDGRNSVRFKLNGEFTDEAR